MFKPENRMQDMLFEDDHSSLMFYNKIKNSI